MTSPPELVRALEDLERALAAFTDAYATWLDAGGDDGELKALLTKAEAQLDRAREALTRLQDSVRA